MSFLVEVYPPFGEPFSEVRDVLIDLGIEYNEMACAEGTAYKANVDKSQLRVLRKVAEETGALIEVIANALEVKA